MSKGLSTYYYQQALEDAKQANLTNAIRHVALSIGLAEAAYQATGSESAEFIKENQQRHKLAGLCYDRMGNYSMAEHCFAIIPDYYSVCCEELERKKKRIDEIKLLVSRRQFKQVIHLLEPRIDQSVLEYQYLGLCYGVLGKQKRASDCFLQALRLDIGNEETIRFIREQESGSITTNKKKGWWTKWITMKA